jgi:chromosome segregation ATPase
MSLEAIIGSVVVALIGAVGGVAVERARSKRETQKEINASVAQVEQARLTDEALKRKEIDEAARDIRDFLRNQVAELSGSIDKIEIARAGEREKWHQMLGALSTKNLDLELQHKREAARIIELEEEAAAIDAQVRMLKTQISRLQTDAVIMSARLDACQRECEDLRSKRFIQTLEKGDLPDGSNEFSS